MSTEPTNERDPQFALLLTQEVLQVAPEDSACLGAIGAAFYGLGEYEQAKRALEKAIANNEDGGNADELFMLGMTCWNLGDKEDAQKLYDRAVNWMEKERPHDRALIRLRGQAAKLMAVE